MLGALEEHDELHRKWVESKTDIEAAFTRVISAWVRPGHIIDLNARGRSVPPCLVGIRVGSGNTRGATKFRIAGEPYVVASKDADPSLSDWYCKAIPISPKTGLEMNAKASGAALAENSHLATLRGSVFPDFSAFDNDESDPRTVRDRFMEMVALAASILGRA